MNRCSLLFSFGARLRTLAALAVLLTMVGLSAPAHAAVPQGTYHIKKTVVRVNGTAARTRSSSYGLVIGADGLAGVDAQHCEKLIKACFRSARMTASVTVEVIRSTATSLRGEFTGTLADGQHLVSLNGKLFSATLDSTGLTVHGSIRNTSGSVKIIYTFLLKRSAR
jgi:hypothetical protein